MSVFMDVPLFAGVQALLFPTDWDQLHDLFVVNSARIYRSDLNITVAARLYASEADAISGNVYVDSFIMGISVGGSDISMFDTYVERPVLTAGYCYVKTDFVGESNSTGVLRLYGNVEQSSRDVNLGFSAFGLATYQMVGI